MMDRTIVDKSWITNAFLVDPRIVKQPRFLQRLANTARLKCVDTTPGGNIYHNPPPQFCRNTDPKEPGIGGSKGMGMGYSMILDDTAELIHMRPGITAYNPLTRFFTKFHDPSLAYLNRTGEARTGIIFKTFEVVGFVTSIPFMPLTFFGQAIDFAMNKPQTKYAYLRYTPALYFTAASTIFNVLTTYRGLQSATYPGSDKNVIQTTVTPEERRRFKELLPDVFKGDGDEATGQIDLFRVATRARRIAAARAEYIEQQLRNASTEAEFYRATLGINENGDPIEPPKLSGAYQNLPDMMNAYLSTLGKYSPDEQVTGEDGESYSFATKEVGYFDKAMSAFMSGFRNGMDWISFRYEGEKTATYSHSHDIGESQLAATLKGLSSTANQMSFSFAGGNIGTGWLAEGIQAGMAGVRTAVEGFMSGLGAGGLVGLGGGAYADLPKQWMDSNSSMPGFSLSLTLKAWSGHPLCIAKRIDLPLSLLLPFMLPRSTGHNSYTSPFHFEYFVRGHSQSRYCMASSGSVQLGDSEGGWTVNGMARSVTVTMNIEHLSTIMHMPVSDGFSFRDTFGSLFADDSAYTDFLASVGSLSYEVQNHNSRFQLFNLRRHLAMQKASDWTNPTRIGMSLAETRTARLASAAYNTWLNLKYE